MITGLDLRDNMVFFMGWFSPVVWVLTSTRRRRLGLASRVVELLHPINRLEVFRQRVVKTSDHLVDGFFPWLFRVLARLNSPEELAQRRLNNVTESVRDLQAYKTFVLIIKTFFSPFAFPFHDIYSKRTQKDACTYHGKFIKLSCMRRQHLNNRYNK